MSILLGFFSEHILCKTVIIFVSSTQIVIILAVLSRSLHHFLMVPSHFLSELRFCHGFLGSLRKVVAVVLLLLSSVSLIFIKRRLFFGRAPRLLPHLIILFSSLYFWQNLVGLINLFKQLFFAFINIRMILFSQLFECLFDLFLGSWSTKIEWFVVVFLCIEFRQSKVLSQYFG